MTPPDPVDLGDFVKIRYAHLRSLQEREHQQAETQRLAHVGGWAWDIASAEVTWSDELYRIFGLLPQEFTPSYEAFFSRIDEAHRAHSEEVVQAALTARTSCVYECSMTRPDGVQRWIRAVCMVDANAAGEPTRMYGTAQDITEFGTVDGLPPTRGAETNIPHGLGSDGSSEGDPDREGRGRALQRAVDGGEFVVHYQPKMAVFGDRMAGVEALLRWQHPERGLVAPLEFIDLAEQTGLIVPIGTWVIEEACRQAARWRESFPDRPPLQVSVNVSVGQCGPELFDVVAGAVAANAIPPGMLCLEVTESVLLHDFDAADTQLQRIVELGVELSIDDFGTGLSSLSRLKHLPLAELKIDKSFVDGVSRDPRDRAIVASIIATAHAMKLRVVAEGVETIEQMQQLRTLGCEEAQGYLFARPGPSESIDEMLRSERTASWVQHYEVAPDAATYRPERVLVVDDTAVVRELAMMTLTAVGFEVHEATDGAGALAAAISVESRGV